MEQGQKFKMKDITRPQIRSMSLSWLWEPGAIVIYKRKLHGTPFSSMIEGKPASMVTMAQGLEAGRDIWIYDDCLDSVCLWE